MWNFLNGYVMIRVSGFSIERFVNLAMAKGLHIWDIQMDGAAVSMKVSVKGFWKLKECGRKTNCHYRIIDKRGLPFFFNRYRKRKVLGLGVLLFVLALYALSSFIWIVQVSGNKRVDTAVILEHCEKLGLKPGSLKFTVDVKKLSEGLITQIPELSWVGVTAKGTNIDIKVVETIPETEVVDRNTPCSIISNQEGIIVSIATAAGTPLVKELDVVEPGDILVSGELEIKEGEEIKGIEYIHAKADIFAKMWVAITEELPLQYEEKAYTGEKVNDYSITVLGKTLNVISHESKYDQADLATLYDKPFAIGDFIFPISIKKEQYREYHIVQKERSEEEAQALLRQILEEQAAERLSEQGLLKDITIEYQEENGTIRANAIITTIDRIGKETPLENIGRNEAYGENGVN